MECRNSRVGCVEKRENSRRAREKEGRCEVEVVCWGMKKSVLIWCGWIYRKEGKRERGKREEGRDKKKIHSSIDI